MVTGSRCWSFNGRGTRCIAITCSACASVRAGFEERVLQYGLCTPRPGLEGRTRIRWHYLAVDNIGGEHWRVGAEVMSFDR